MSKYKVGDELIIVENKTEDVEKLKEMSKLEVKDSFATFSWGIKILNVEYNAPTVTVTYIDIYGEENKAYAVCKDPANFNEERVLEKALLKAFQSEITNITVRINDGIKKCDAPVK